MKTIVVQTSASLDYKEQLFGTNFVPNSCPL